MIDSQKHGTVNYVVQSVRKSKASVIIIHYMHINREPSHSYEARDGEARL